MHMQHGNIVQYDQVAAPYTFHYFIIISSEHKIISPSVGGLRTATQHK